MIKKAQRRFVIISSIATLVVTLVLILAVNLVNVYQTNRNLHAVLVEFADEEAIPEGGLPDPIEIGDSGGASGDSSAGESEPVPEEAPSEGEEPLRGEETAPGETGASGNPSGQEGQQETLSSLDQSLQEAAEEFYADARRGNGRIGRYSPFTQYGNRLFSVMLHKDGAIIINLDNENLIADVDLESIALQIRDSGKTEGYLEDYLYLRRDDSEGSIIYFLDCSTELKARSTLWWISFMIGGAGIILAFIFIVWMSTRIILPIRESIEKQKEFITNAGHELKTPISVIGTYMDILSMDLGENEWVDGTKKQVKKLRSLVGQLISLARMDETDTELEYLPFNISSAAAESSDPYVDMAAVEGKTVIQEITENLYVLANETTIRQLFTILCDNAVKYAVGEEPIRVRLYEKGRDVVFETVNAWDHSTDSGNLNRLFDRFYRGDESRDRSSGKNSYGLGLSIAIAIVNKNRAHIDVSEDNAGNLVFRVSLRKEK